MKAKAQRIQQRFQYRLLWNYQGSRRVHELRADKPAPILKMLRRVATKVPWLGMGRTALRKGWARLCMRLGVPFEAVEGLSPRDVAQRIQDTFPRLEWCRVEHRQVGEWVETLDPLNTLRTAGTDKTDATTEALFDDVATWETAKLDEWRTRITPEFLAGRKTASNNRERAK